MSRKKPPRPPEGGGFQLHIYDSGDRAVGIIHRVGGDYIVYDTDDDLIGVFVRRKLGTTREATVAAELRRLRLNDQVQDICAYALTAAVGDDLDLTAAEIMPRRPRRRPRRRR